MLFLLCVYNASVLVIMCCLMVTCWERADLLALVCDVLLRACYFPIDILGKVWYLIVSIPDLCLLSYFVICIVNLTRYTNVLYT